MTCNRNSEPVQQVKFGFDDGKKRMIWFRAFRLATPSLVRIRSGWIQVIPPVQIEDAEIVIDFYGRAN